MKINRTAVNTYDVHKFNVSFDFNIEACASGKSSNIALLGGSNAGTWLSSDKTDINNSSSGNW